MRLDDSGERRPFVGASLGHEAPYHAPAVPAEVGQLGPRRFCVGEGRLGVDRGMGETLCEPAEFPIPVHARSLDVDRRAGQGGALPGRRMGCGDFGSEDHVAEVGSGLVDEVGWWQGRGVPRFEVWMFDEVSAVAEAGDVPAVEAAGSLKVGVTQDLDAVGVRNVEGEQVLVGAGEEPMCAGEGLTPADIRPAASESVSEA